MSDLSIGLEDMAGLIFFQVGAWQDFGYEEPPTPDSQAIPPLGERSVRAIKAGHAAIDNIDRLIRQLHELRAQLADELRQDSDIRGARVDAMLAARKAEREGSKLMPDVLDEIESEVYGERSC